MDQPECTLIAHMHAPIDLKSLPIYSRRDYSRVLVGWNFDFLNEIYEFL